MKKQLSILGIALLSSACAVEKNEPTRITNPTETFGVVEGNSILPLHGALNDVEESACARLASLDTLSGNPRYTYFQKIEGRPHAWTGAIEISESPFTQFILGEKFVNGNEEEFYKKAKEERAAGRIGGMKWFFLNFMKGIGSLSTVQHSATNDKLAENFPGIFGERGDLEKSLFLSLAHRATDLKKVPSKEAEKILTSSLPLFPESREWSEFPAAIRGNLGAALNGLKKEATEKERLCSLVLFHHHFAQLLRLKGHNSPKVYPPRWKKYPSYIEELSSSQPEFVTQEVPGAFYDWQLKRAVVISNESISNYDPREQALGITTLIPNGKADQSPGSLGDSLSLMEALAYSFEASSPASSLVEERGYIFGDLQAKDSKALLPAEAHSLALGLLSMNFKNLAALHIRKVNAKGLLVQDQSAAAGIVVGRRWNGEISELHLMDVIRLARVVAYLDVAMNRFRAKEPYDWEQMNPVYNKKTLASLMGPALFTPEELESILSPAERSSVLKDNLKALKFPLALLLARMGTSAKGCVSAVEWNGLTGMVKPLAPCNRAQLAELADVLEKLARESQSPLLLKKAEEIRAKL
jgi:hypothetical protein